MTDLEAMTDAVIRTFGELGLCMDAFARCFSWPGCETGPLTMEMVAAKLLSHGVTVVEVSRA